MSTSPRQTFVSLFAPLSLAAYAAWAAVFLSLSAPLAQGAAVAFLLLFMLEHLIGSRLSKRGFVALGLLLATLGLLVSALSPYSPAPILLILTAATLATRLEMRDLLLTLLPINGGFAWVVFGFGSGRVQYLLITFASFLSFQLFAALVMRYAARSEAMSEQLQVVNADLIATRSLLEESARDAERLRLSRELHDVAGHALTALKLNLGVLRRDARQPDPQRVALCAELADDLLQSLRGVVRQMRVHEGIDLRSAITQLAAPFPKPSVLIDIDEAARPPDIASAQVLLRTVQEGLTNAARHAGATQVWLSLRRTDDGLLLEIRDDGRGAQDLHTRMGTGLRGMRERLLEHGGDVAFDQGAEGGLRLRARLPAVLT